MKKFDANIIIKNLTGILCGAMILCFLLPFVSSEVKASVAGASGSAAESVNGFSLLTEGGFLGIMLFLCPILILIANYLPQLGQYKKIISLILSVAGIIILFLSPAQLSAQGGNQSFSVDVKTTYQIGFWLMLVCSATIALLSAIQFFNLNGNKIFDTLNNSNEIQNTENSDDANSDDSKVQISKLSQINFDKDKVTDFAKNTSSAISEQIKNVAGNVSNKVSSMQKEKPEEIMEQLKKLYELKEAGILTEEEFTAKKQEMLQRM